MSGTETYVTTAVSEFFLKGSEPTGYCDVHGVGGGGLAGGHDYGADGEKSAQSYAIPIQPKQPLLLGNDPYGSEQPDFAPKDTSARRGDQSGLNFDQLDEEDKDATITLDRPKRIEINEE